MEAEAVDVVAFVSTPEFVEVVCCSFVPLVEFAYGLGVTAGMMMERRMKPRNAKTVPC